MIKVAKVTLELVNDYSDGRDNGKIKYVACFVNDPNDIEEIKNYIMDVYKLNLDDMWKIKAIEPGEYLFAETIADIALEAGYLMAYGDIEVDDSRNLINDIYKWAHEFECSDYDSDNYMEELENFASNKLMEKYGVRKVKKMEL